jgi:predicted PurR-regulated permease PerM
MFGFDARVAKITWTVIFVSAVAWVAWLLRDLWFLLAVALFFSYMLAPVVTWVESHLPSRLMRAKTQALLLVYVALLAGIGAAVSWVVGNALTQASGLAEKIPDLMKNQDALLTFPLPAWLEPARQSAVTWAKHLLAGGFEQFLPALRAISGQLLIGLGNLTLFLLVPIFGFYFLKDGHELSEAIVERFRPEHRPFVQAIFQDLNLLLSQYIRAVVLLSLATFVSFQLFFWATGMPYSTLLATLAALTEFIPVIGPVTAGVTAVLVGGMTGYPLLIVLVLFLVIYRLFLDYVLSPLLMSSGVELHPLLVLGAILAGEHLGGISGMFLAIPVVAAARIVYLRLEARSRTEVVR